MIVKMTNKDDDFYSYMGKFFGSRIVQSETKDRIYDDNNKVWYIYLNSDATPKACAFVSVCDGVIKNIYSNSNEYLEKLLLSVKHDIPIKDSIVTKIYEDIYVKCGFKVHTLDTYKHFIMIRGEND